MRASFQRRSLEWRTLKNPASRSLRCSRPTHSSKPFVMLYSEGLERLRRRQGSRSERKLPNKRPGRLFNFRGPSGVVQ